MRTRMFSFKAKKPGMLPGSLVHVGEKKAETVRIRVIDYTETLFKEEELQSIEECRPYQSHDTITWINVDGLHDVQVIGGLGDIFNIHPLVQEDILNTDKRPKLEDMGDYIQVILKMLSVKGPDGDIDTEQVSVILGRNFVITFQEREGDVFEEIRNRIRNSKGRIRKMGADYLAYALIDAIVDHYFLALEAMGDRIEQMEDEVLNNPSRSTIQTLHGIKRNLLIMRKSTWPLREVNSRLERSDSDLIRKNSRIYFRDVYDHNVQIIDMVETMRDMTAGMVDLYLSSISNKMNEVMKVLTIIATIFIPLTFIAGIYGMNFEYMPELKWRAGYLTIWGVMIAVFIIMIIFFKRKKWL